MDYEQIHVQLATRRDELLRRVTKLKREVHNRDEPYSADFAEQAVELENLDVLFELDREGREELARVNKAIMRLENDEYDICMGCNNEISRERLEAIPYTDLCIHCAEAKENVG